MSLPMAYSLMEEFPYVDAWTETPKEEINRPPPDAPKIDLTPEEARRASARGAIVLPDP